MMLNDTHYTVSTHRRWMIGVLWRYIIYIYIIIITCNMCACTVDPYIYKCVCLFIYLHVYIINFMQYDVATMFNK